MSDRVGGLLFADVELAPDERVLASDAAAHWRRRWSSSWGRLHLTNQRLIFTGMPLISIGLFPLPFVPQTVAIHRSDISGAGRVEGIWPEYLRRGIAADAFFVDTANGRYHFAVLLGKSAQWVQALTHENDPH